ncbi:chitin elicitor receptor kinase 1-like [Cocos nucifera]|nr:chitin elicitor receptor kinase 1-like [Cocos nucifera]
MIGYRRPFPGFQFLLLLLFRASFLLQLESKCQNGCDLALGSYYVTAGLNLSYITGLFGLTYRDVSPYNPNITDQNYVVAGSRVNVYFPCDCINGDFLGHSFSYVALSGDTYQKVATDYFANLTTAAWLAKFNRYSSTQIPDGATINVTVNCSCGNKSVSHDYGLFETYPLRPGENLSSVAEEFELSSKEDLLQEYNPGVNFSAGKGIVFIPTKDGKTSTIENI